MQPPGVMHLFFLLVSLLSVPTLQILAPYIKPKHKPKPKPKPKPRLSFVKSSTSGGARYAVFTVMSWLMWAVSLGFAAPVVSPFKPIPVPSTHVGVLYGAAMACSIVGFVFSIKALIVYELTHKQAKKIRMKRVLSAGTGFALVLFLGMVLSVLSGMLLVAVDYLPDVSSQLLYCMLSICCALIAASSTYGLGGHLCHVQESSQPTSWRFFQPFKGGTAFVASQGLGWSLFSIFIVCILKIMGELWHGIVVALQWWALRSWGIILATQLILGFSVLTFQNCVAKDKLSAHPLKQWIENNVPLILMYMATHIFLAVFVATFTLLPTKPVALFWVTFLIAYYIFTTRGHPNHTGCRKWPRVRMWFNKHVTNCMRNWQGEAELIYAGGKQPTLADSYIFGFHPHGLFPIGAAALPLLEGFDRLFPGITPATLAASMMFLPPIQRDLLHWWGVREVSRRTFIEALKDEKAIIVCPGGQEELAEAYKIFRNPSTLVICKRHKGFCRLAIEQQASLVPVLALGETFTVNNAFDAPKLQMATYRILGFPIPYLLVGRWGFAPLPKKVPLLYIMGKAIKPPSVESGSSIPQEAVDSLHHQYYGELVRLFHEYKGQHAHYAETEIAVKDGHQ